jgi:acetyl-CoA carboxylase biotin carboxyl carrier protein
MAKKRSGRKAAAPPAAAEAANGDLAILRELVALLENSAATSVRLQRGEVSYEVSRGGQPVSMAAPAAHRHSAAPAADHAPAPAVAPPAAAPASNLLEIKSPMVGTFYRSPEPGAEAYVKAGSRITPGQTLCIIEAMKIMNEIESEVTGAVREILVEEAQPVEFGQVLFRVDPNG